MKLSIIIPVYNVEKYLRRCLDSCLNQNVEQDSYEIIVINDGSQDRSLCILEEYKDKFKNFNIINQENQGLSIARNNGLEIAKGEFIWFVDSDDWIVDNCLRYIYSNLNDDIECLQLPFYFYYEGTDKIENYKKNIWHGVLSGTEAYINNFIYIAAQFTIYRREFLERYSLKFFPKIYHEDIEFKPRVLVFTKKIKCLDKPVYYYFQRKKGSICSTFSIKNAEGYMKAIESLIKFRNTNKIESYDLKVLNIIIAKVLLLLIKNSFSLEKKYQKQIRDFIKDKKISVYLKRSGIKKHIYIYYLYSLMPCLLKILTKK